MPTFRCQQENGTAVYLIHVIGSVVLAHSNVMGRSQSLRCRTVASTVFVATDSSPQARIFRTIDTDLVCCDAGPNFKDQVHGRSVLADNGTAV
jgi:hypothetical protein